MKGRERLWKAWDVFDGVAGAFWVDFGVGGCGEIGMFGGFDYGAGDERGRWGELPLTACS